MSVQIIDLADTYAQTLRVTLAGQDCRIDLRQVSTGLYLTLYVSDRMIVANAMCRDRNRVVRSEAFGFIGDLAFVDTQGTTDPASPGLGTRYYLCFGDIEA